jgi:hypothetical protein
MWRAGWLYSKFFETYWNFPLTLICSERRTNYDDNSRGARIWKIGITYIIGYLHLLLRSFSLFAHISVEDLGTAFLCGFDVIISIMNILFCYIILRHGEMVNISINFLITLGGYMKYLQGKKKQKSAPNLIGTALIATTVEFGILPYFATLAVPLIPIPLLSPIGNDLATTMEVIFRRILFFISGHEFCRTMDFSEQSTTSRNYSSCSNNSENFYRFEF